MNPNIEYKVKRIFEVLRDELNCEITWDDGWVALTIKDLETDGMYQVITDNFNGSIYDKNRAMSFPVENNFRIEKI